MTLPKVTINEIDGALGVLPPSSGRNLAVVGPVSALSSPVPVAFGKVKSMSDYAGIGPAVHAAARHIETVGDPVVLVPTAKTTTGAAGAVTNNVTGTSVPTADTSSLKPVDDYEVYVKFETGGTIGVAGITFRYSLDGGRTMSELIALGTAVTYTIPGGTNVKVNFGAGTIIANDNFSFRTTAPCWNTADLTAALDALRVSSHQVDLVEIVGPIDGSAFDAIETAIAAFHAAGKFVTWIGNTRVPNVGESEAAYKTALDTIFSAKATTKGALCAGSVKLISSLDGKQYKRPFSHVVGSLEARYSEEVNVADPSLGPLVGVSIRDANGNPDEHDEAINPGLDDSGHYVARTIEGRKGVYVNLPRIFSAEGSDFEFVPHRRVMNIAHAALKAYFELRLNKPILVNASTGFILEEEALEIEAGARAVMRGQLLAKPKASGIQFTLSRTDNILSTKTLSGTARVIPLAYPVLINLDVGFFNPTLAVQAV